MRLFKKYVNQTRKPEGFLGKMMVNGMNGGHAKMADWGMSHLPEIKPEEMLEIGCGGGRNAGELMKKYPFAKITAIDYSEVSVAKATGYNRSGIESGRCKVRQGDVSNLDLPDRYEYNCNGYHRYGKEYCTAHRIDEAMLDELIYSELLSIKERAIANYQSIESDVKRWIKQKSNVSNKLAELNRTLRQRMTDQEEILLERIRDKEHTEIYTRMLKLCEDDIERLKKEIAAITDYSATIKKRKAEMKESVDLIEQIIQEGAISDANLRLLVDSIVISEKDKKLHIKINLNAKFERHKDCYDEEGNITERIFIA